VKSPENTEEDLEDPEQAPEKGIQMEFFSD
jgi:hypothetical protein